MRWSLESSICLCSQQPPHHHYHNITTTTTSPSPHYHHLLPEGPQIENSSCTWMRTPVGVVLSAHSHKLWGWPGHPYYIESDGLEECVVSKHPATNTCVLFPDSVNKGHTPTVWCGCSSTPS